MTTDGDRPVILAGEDLIKEFRVSGRGRAFGGRRTFRAVDAVSLTLREGETLGLVGESGSGKSTTARMMGRLVDVTAGRVLLAGTDVTTAGGPGLRDFRRSVQFVFQDPYSSLNPRQNVEELVSAPLRYQRISVPGGPVARVKELMERVGLNPDHSRRYPMQFSGGQAQRIGIARAISCNPKVIICDEPVSALDVSVQAQVLRLLADLQADFGFSYLFISHDLAVVRQVAHRVSVMRQGRIVEEGDAAELFAEPRHEYTRTLLAAVPTIPAEWERQRHDRERTR